MSDIIDRASELEERHRDAALAAHWAARRAQEMARSRTAMPGRSCASCGDPIDPRRMVIIPDAVRCVTCENSRRR